MDAKSSFAAGMEAAAALCDEEAHSACELAKEAGRVFDRAAQDRMDDLAVRVATLANVIRAFAADPDWLASACATGYSD